MKTLYFDCFSGVSGDMTIGALLDAGGDFTRLEQELQKLQMEEEYDLKVKSVDKNGITALKFDVLLSHDDSHHHHEHTHHTHDHSEHSLISEHHGSTDVHHHDQDKHDHTHSPVHMHEHHHHRSYRDIVKLISSSELTGQVKDTSLRIFKKIGEAEGRIHGMPLDDVHFHEVGAVDSIIDIVGTAILLEQLGIEKIKSSSVPTGSGQVHIDHGVYPVPAPATLEILKGVPLAMSNLKGELTTPTGAAFVAVLAEEFTTFPSMKVRAIGYGAGMKSFPQHPNVLRIVIGEE